MTWEGRSCNRYGSGFMIFSGDGGTLELDASGNHRAYDLHDKRIDESTAKGRGDMKHLMNFVSAILNDQSLNLNVEITEGHKSTWLYQLGNTAQCIGRNLHCDLQTRRVLRDPEAMALWNREYDPFWEPRV